MSGTNENELGTLHAKLCAYVLGEASAAERAEVEAALAASGELRAERARLEATIGLVRGTLAAGTADELSPAATSALEAAAAARGGRARPLSWYRRPALRLAAGLAAVGLLWATWSRSQEDPGRHLVPDASQRIAARQDQPPAAPAQARERLLDGVAPSSSLAKKDRSRGKEEPGVALENLGYLEADRDASSAPAPRSEEPVALAQRESEVTGQTLEELDRLGYADESHARTLDSGHYATGAPAVSSGTHRGPGDTRPPSAEEPLLTGPALPGAALGGVASAPAKQATGGPRAYSTRRAGGGGKGRVASQSAVSDQELQKLRELGYVEGDESTDGASEVLEELGYYTGAGRPVAGPPRRQGRLIDALDACRRLPNERPRDMFFRFFGDNPFQATAVDPLSTFAADVDTASYALARRYLVDGILPEKAQIRTEEFVNYFDPDVPAPLEGTFAIHAELAPSRFGEPGGDSWMLRVAVRGRDVAREERQPLALTFVVDVSGSMEQGGRLELVKHALRLLLGELDLRDSIAIVAFSTEARVVLPMTSARHRALVETAIHQLRPEGSTNAEAGLRLGYELARSELAAGSHHRVVLLSDGVANVGETRQRELTAAVEEHRRAGIYLNTVGVGMGNHNDALLERLADEGDGVCNYVDDAAEARRALVERFTGAFEPIARDVKLQVEFDPAQVRRYRLLGYENRAVADRDFENDAVDAGEVNAGHQVVALYELSAAPSQSSERPLATVRLRYKPPHAAGVADAETEAASEIERAVSWEDARPSFAAASAGYRRSVLVAQFAELLRRSVHARCDSLDELLAEARALEPELEDPEFAELADLIERSRDLILAERARRDDRYRALESVREACYLEAELEELNLLLGRERLHDLEDALRELTERIDDLRERIQAEEDAFSLRPGELEALEAENQRLAERLSEHLRELSSASGR